MKVYIAGPLSTEKERKALEKIDQICKNLNIKTFLPHRDVGLWKTKEDTKKIAREDLNGFKGCSLLIALLNGFGVSPGTAWEMGYANARDIPVIALKNDKNPDEYIEDISAIIFGTTKIVSSLEELEDELKKLI
jgi:nucleoside 2-deoxyribosyltransferase